MLSINKLKYKPGKGSALLGFAVLSIASAVLLSTSLTACNNKKTDKEVDCVPATDPAGNLIKQRLEKFHVNIPKKKHDPNTDWCRACVMSHIGFASCQKVYSTGSNENKETLKARARETACLDAKFPKDACPDSAIISLSCKGDAPPPGTKSPGVALQNLYVGTKKAAAKSTSSSDPVNKK